MYDLFMDFRDWFVSVGMIIGILVVAGINHWLSFLGSTIRSEERAK